MKEATAQLVTVVLLLALGIAWDFVLEVGKALVDEQYPDSTAVVVAEALMTAVMISGVVYCLRRQMRAHGPDQRQLWFSVGSLCTLWASTFGQDLTSSIVSMFYTGAFNEWREFVTLLVVVSICTAIIAIFLYASGVDNDPRACAHHVRDTRRSNEARSLSTMVDSSTRPYMYPGMGPAYGQFVAKEV